jgi:hypothetical protein
MSASRDRPKEADFLKEDEFYQVVFCKKEYFSIKELWKGLEGWFVECNEHCPHSGKYFYGRDRDANIT